MALRLSAVLRPLFRLSADSFPLLAAQRFGAQRDLDQTWRAFEPVACTLVDSFYTTIDHPDLDDLTERLDEVAPELRGIAYEGAGMGLMLLDCLFPYRKRLPVFLHGPGAPYRGLVYIGAGLVLPRIPMAPNRFVAGQEPLLRWLVMDGYGFYDGFFNWRDSIERQTRPDRVHGYGRRAYDQGIGRSLWFATGANVDRIADTIAAFPGPRRADLWSGIGLACAYAAGVMDRQAIRRLITASGTYSSHLAVGVAIASIFREQSGLPAPHTDLACAEIWERDAEGVAAIAHRAGHRARGVRDLPSYSRWREEIRKSWMFGSRSVDRTKERSA